MKVKELIEFLSTRDPNEEVLLWNAEWDSKDPIDYIEVDLEGDLIIF